MLAPWKESYDNPKQTIKKQRHYFANKDPSSQSYDFSCNHEWTWELDHKKDWRIDAFELWCWRVPWTRGDQISQSWRKSTVNINWKDCCWSWCSNTGHLMWRVNSLEKTVMLGKIEGMRRREQQRMSWLIASSTQLTWIWANSQR